MRLLSWCMAAQMLACGTSMAADAPSETVEARPHVTGAGGAPRRRKPGTREMVVVGALAGVGLGMALGDRSGATYSPLTPLTVTDAILSGATMALFAAPHLFDRASPDSFPRVPPRELNGFDKRIRDFAVGHRSAVGRERLDAISAATLAATVLAPVGVLAASDVPHKWERDLPIVVEATALSLAASGVVKHVAHRSRPVDRFCADRPGQLPCRKDTRLSFYSGHTTAAFAAAVATGSIASQHGLDHEQWIWATQLALASTTGALRVMSDQHFASDVLVGMVTGGLVGWLVPALHKPEQGRAASPAAHGHSPVAVVAVPISLHSGSAMAVTAGVPAGGGISFGLRWQLR